MKTDIGTVTLRKIISKVDCSRGAPMGRSDVAGSTAPKGRIYSRYVPMDRTDGDYDIGGAYWGLGGRLRVSFTADMDYVRFYREGE